MEKREDILDLPEKADQAQGKEKIKKKEMQSKVSQKRGKNQFQVILKRQKLKKNNLKHQRILARKKKRSFIDI